MTAELQREIKLRIEHLDKCLRGAKHHGYDFYPKFSVKFEALKASYCTLELQTAKSKPWPLTRLIAGSSSGSSSTQTQLDLLNKELQKLEMPIYGLNALAQKSLCSASYQPLDLRSKPVVAKTLRTPLSLEYPRVFAAESPEGALLIENSEREKWRSLRHPNILRILGTANFQGSYCLVSELVPNGNVVDYIRKHPQAPVLGLIRDVAAAVEYLHVQCGLVHGDIKPTNMLVTAEGRALLCDFATVKRSGDDSSSNSRNKKSALYLSPEILALVAERRTKASDMWAFGISVAQIIKRASSPWENGESSREQVHQKVVQDDGRPTPPARFSDPKEAAAWKVAAGCWEWSSQERLDISAMIRRLPF